MALRHRAVVPCDGCALSRVRTIALLCNVNDAHCSNAHVWRCAIALLWNVSGAHCTNAHAVQCERTVLMRMLCNVNAYACALVRWYSVAQIMCDGFNI